MASDWGLGDCFLGYELSGQHISLRLEPPGLADNRVSCLAKFRSIGIKVPRPAEQAAIERFDMGSEIATLEAKLGRARAFKQGMMQNLLTGAIRLPVDGAGAIG